MTMLQPSFERISPISPQNTFSTITPMKRRLFLLIATFATLALHATTDSLRVSIFGDSYSTFEGYIPATHEPWYAPEGSRFAKDQNDVRRVEETWWWQVVQTMGYRLETNNSWSGSTVGYFGYQNENYQPRSFNTRVAYLGEPDIILCCCATNDSWTGEKVGEYKYANWTENDLWYCRPAMARLLSTMKQNYPTAVPYIIVNTELRDDIVESITTICRHYAVKCILLHDIDKQMGHPSKAGMKAIATQVVEALRKL